MYQWTIVWLNPPCNESNPNNKYSQFRFIDNHDFNEVKRKKKLRNEVNMDDIARFNESTPKVFVLESWGIWIKNKVIVEVKVYITFVLNFCCSQWILIKFQLGSSSFKCVPQHVPNNTSLWWLEGQAMVVKIIKQPLVKVASNCSNLSRSKGNLCW
jgi:hypothetical protein